MLNRRGNPLLRNQPKKLMYQELQNVVLPEQKNAPFCSWVISHSLISQFTRERWSKQEQSCNIDISCHISLTLQLLVSPADDLFLIFYSISILNISDIMVRLEPIDHRVCQILVKGLCRILFQTSKLPVWKA